MSIIKIKITNDIRNVLKSGEVYTFDFDSENYNKDNWIAIVGDNGSGKSTLINCIRDWKCDNKGENRTSNGGRQSMKLGYMEFITITGNYEIKTDFEQIFVLSSEFDDPQSMNNCGDAIDYIEFGGFSTSTRSAGQKIQYITAKFLTENMDKFNDKTLLVFDEIDRGFDLRYQQGVLNMFKNLHTKCGCKILAIVHNLYPILKSKNEIFCMDKKCAMSGETYVVIKTGHLITIENLDEDSDEKSGECNE